MHALQEGKLQVGVGGVSVAMALEALGDQGPGGRDERCKGRGWAGRQRPSVPGWQWSAPDGPDSNT